MNSKSSPCNKELDAFFESIPVEGSLGLLALGAVGVITWRKKRKFLKTNFVQKDTGTSGKFR